MLTRDDLIDAIGGLDTDLVEEFVRADNRLQAKKTRRVSLNVRFVALAACFALLFVSLPLMARLWEGPEVPVFEGAVYTASELLQALQPQYHSFRQHNRAQFFEGM